MGRLVVAAGLVVAALSFSTTTAMDGTARTALPASDVLEPVECPIRGTQELADVDCADVTVPERHEDPDGRQIKLLVAVVHSRAAQPEPDPVLYLAGGPGASALETLPIWAGSSLLDDRDLILLEQRGTYFSQPALDCPLLGMLETSLAFDRKYAPDIAAAVGEEAVRCRAQHVATADLSAYTTAQNAADIVSLRAALDIEQWNLYGGSYGTRLALELLRTDSAAVRAAVLDSVVPPDAAMYTDAAANGAAAVEGIMAACEADAACAADYPDLPAMYDAARARFAETPRYVTVPVAGEPDTGWAMVIDHLTPSAHAYASAAGGDVRYVPVQLEALAAGNTEFLSLQPVPYFDFIADGMNLSVECSERLAYEDRDAVAAAWARHPHMAELLAIRAPHAACEGWEVPPADASTREPVVSDVPALLLAGTVDPLTPPAYAHRAARTLSRATVVEFPGGGHGFAVGDPCAQAIRDAFLADPSRAPDVACAADGPSFVTGISISTGTARMWRDLVVDPQPAIAGALGVGSAVLGLIAVAAVWLMARRRVPALPWAFVLALAATLAILATVLAVTWVVVGPAVAVYGLPDWLGWAVILPPLAAVLLATLVVGGLWAIARGTVAWRGALALLATSLAAGVLVALLAHYGLLWPTG